jgi:hypothetical protein
MYHPSYAKMLDAEWIEVKKGNCWFKCCKSWRSNLVMFQTTKKLNPWLLTKKDTRNTELIKKRKLGIPDLKTNLY